MASKPCMDTAFNLPTTREVNATRQSRQTLVKYHVNAHRLVERCPHPYRNTLKDRKYLRLCKNASDHPGLVNPFP
jgi:hypothetical protein